MVHGVTVLEREREIKQTGNPATITGCLTVLGESGSWHRAVGSMAVTVSKLVLDFSAKNI